MVQSFCYEWNSKKPIIRYDAIEEFNVDSKAEYSA